MFGNSSGSLQNYHFLGTLGTCFTLVVFSSLGCGSSEPFDYVPSSGRISYEDNTPLPIEGTLRLTFYLDAPPVDGKFFARPGAAIPDKDGNFEAMTLHPGDGLVPGKHNVTVSYMGRSTNGIIPKTYTLKNETPLEVDTSQQPFDIKIPKP